MKKIICKKEYDTETATLIKKHMDGEQLIIAYITKGVC